MSRHKYPYTTRPAFSLAEVLIALAITGTLLTASLAALDASFKSYKLTTESASTNVVSRMVMQRVMSMLRNGIEFGPYPMDVLDASQNPVVSDAVEFVALDDGVNRRVVRLEMRETDDVASGPNHLWFIQTDFANGVETSQEERPLLTGVANAVFTLHYGVGPRLERATVDLTIRPNDYQEASFGSDMDVPVIRMVSSVAPRRLD
jgi:prepilin-type N-terminal cleavage/methylation domain-containing protein